MRWASLKCALLVFSLCASFAVAQDSAGNTPFIAMGDSIGEGVQSGDANRATQPNSYLNLIARQMAVPFPLPLIHTTPISFVGGTILRGRIFDHVEGANLAVSGADTSSVINDRADNVINSETDLVLSPRTGSQLEIAEQAPSSLMVYWLGSNDVLGAILAFDHLDGTQMTSVPEFTANLDQSLMRLKAAGKAVVLGNLVRVTEIAFTLDRQQLARFAGSDFGLPEGSRTTIVAGLLLRLGLADASLLQNPDWVLDPAEIDTIQQRVDAFNTIIASRAAFYGFPVVDVASTFAQYAADPPVIAGIPATIDYNGGIFSLDGVHPSNTGHALLTNLFIQTMNSGLGMSIPQLTQAEMDTIGLNDPFLDLDGDGLVRGRPGKGILETLGPVLGISGDMEGVADQPPVPAGAGRKFLDEFQRFTGADLRGPAFDQAVRAMKVIFGFGPRRWATGQ